MFYYCSFPLCPALHLAIETSFLLKKYHGGYVVIRLALAGHKQANRPFYRIVAAYNKRARDEKYIEQLGSYDPLPNIYNEKLVSFNFDRIKYWIGCGAHPTKPVAKLLGLAGFFPLHPMTITEAERPIHLLNYLLITAASPILC
uniref:Small ribosomal subunit protein bS16m n=1 Tax=Anabas testudineus TaxID=64144 RepID=A0A7N6BWU0_ANATE